MSCTVEVVAETWNLVVIASWQREREKKRKREKEREMFCLFVGPKANRDNRHLGNGRSLLFGRVGGLVLGTQVILCCSFLSLSLSRLFFVFTTHRHLQLAGWAQQTYTPVDNSLSFNMHETLFCPVQSSPVQSAHSSSWPSSSWHTFSRRINKPARTDGRTVKEE